MNKKVFTDISSLAVHSGHQQTGEKAHVMPVFATSTFTFDSTEQGMNRFTGQEPGFIYSRFGNPTTEAAAAAIATLEAFGITDENGKQLQLKAILHASGQAAMATLFFSNLSAGDTILTNESIYSGTYEFLTGIAPQFGIRNIFADLSDLQAVETIIRNTPSLKLIHFETPSNPTMGSIDIEEICKLAKPQSVKVSIDNTFATPYLQQPFKWGVDFVYHSTTKFLNGHGTAIGGVLLGRDLEFMKGKAYKTYKLLGGNSNPFDAFLLINGIKTLAIRMDKHCSNALEVAHFLDQHPAVSKVHYNGLQTHPHYAITLKQMRHAGAVLSFELKGGLKAGKTFINKLQMCTRAVSLGTVDTLISHPASMSHSGMKPEERIKSGISDGLIRMSVGIESIVDIINDLEQALRE